MDTGGLIRGTQSKVVFPERGEKTAGLRKRKETM